MDNWSVLMRSGFVLSACRCEGTSAGADRGGAPVRAGACTFLWCCTFLVDHLCLRSLSFFLSVLVMFGLPSI